MPRRECINEFKKLVPAPDQFYMPVWEVQELSAIAPLYPRAADVWEMLFKGLGGVPRLVFQNRVKDPQVVLRKACKSSSLDDCIKLVSSSDAEVTSKTQAVQTLVHIRSQEPYITCNVVYASDLAESDCFYQAFGMP